jgi:hypothetical protein
MSATISNHAVRRKCRPVHEPVERPRSKDSPSPRPLPWERENGPSVVGNVERLLQSRGSMRENLFENSYGARHLSWFYYKYVTPTALAEPRI